MVFLLFMTTTTTDEFKAAVESRLQVLEEAAGAADR